MSDEISRLERALAATPRRRPDPARDLANQRARRARIKQQRIADGYCSHCLCNKSRPNRKTCEVCAKAAARLVAKRPARYRIDRTRHSEPTLSVLVRLPVRVALAVRRISQFGGISRNEVMRLAAERLVEQVLR